MKDITNKKVLYDEPKDMTLYTIYNNEIYVTPIKATGEYKENEFDEGWYLTQRYPKMPHLGKIDVPDISNSTTTLFQRTDTVTSIKDYSNNPFEQHENTTYSRQNGFKTNVNFPSTDVQILVEGNAYQTNEKAKELYTEYLKGREEHITELMQNAINQGKGKQEIFADAKEQQKFNGINLDKTDYDSMYKQPHANWAGKNGQFFEMDGQEYEAPIWNLLDRLRCDSYGKFFNASNKKQVCPPNTRVMQNGFGNDVFEIHPYYWGNDEKLEDMANFIYHPIDLEIRWYKHAGRDMYSNMEISPDMLEHICDKCIESTKDIELNINKETEKNKLAYEDKDEFSNNIGSILGKISLNIQQENENKEKFKVQDKSIDELVKRMDTKKDKQNTQGTQNKVIDIKDERV